MTKATRDGTVLFLLTMIGNGSLFLAQVLFGRLLPPQEYGVLGSLLALLQVVSVPFGVLQMVTAAAYARGEREHAGLGVIGRMIPWLAGTFVVMLLATPLLVRGGRVMLHLPDSLGLVLVMLTAILGAVGSVLRGFCQGRHLFAWLGFSYILEFSGRLLIGAGLLFVWPSARSAVIGILVSTSLSVLWLLLPLLRHASSAGVPNRVGRLLMLALVQNVIMGWVSTFDIVWVRAHFPALTGYYTAAGIATRIHLALAGVFAMLLFPRVEQAMAAGENPKGHLVTIGRMVAALGVSGGAAMYVLGSWLIPLLFGSSYAQSVGWFRALSFAVLPLGWAFVTSQYDVATRSTARLGLMATAALVYGGGLIYFCVSVTGLIAWMVSVWTVYLVIWAYLRQKSGLPRSASSAQPLQNQQPATEASH